MGEAKRKGATFEERKAKAIKANGGEERPNRLGAFEKRQIERAKLRAVMDLKRALGRRL